jgi:MYXO-CTERM domain-containing protein
VVALGGLSAVPAHAANTAKPRVSPSFLGGSCVQTIERGTALRFDLGIPYEDDALSEDEPDDSRTFQFFALCRDPAPLEELPLWIDDDDVTRAQAVNMTVEDATPEQVMQTSPVWSGPGHDGADGSCVVAMTSEAERMSITCEATREGFTWDGGDAPAGSYVVYGYTYEPADNLWTARGGVVRVVEPGDPDAAGPAVAFSFPLSLVDVSFEGGVVVHGCVEGAEGTTLAIDWATAPMLDDIGDDAWQELPDVELDGGTFAVDFVPPIEAEHKAVFFRARAQDPQGRTFVGYTHDPVVVVRGCAEPSGGQYPSIDSCDVGVEGDWSTQAVNAVDCDGVGTGEVESSGGSEGTATDAGSSDAGTDTDAPTAAGQREGCGCRSAPNGGLLALLALGALRRRRRSRR